ncbi:MAG: hypothetical protein WCK98_06310 [bacterium]
MQGDPFKGFGDIFENKFKQLDGDSNIVESESLPQNVLDMLAILETVQNRFKNSDNIRYKVNSLSHNNKVYHVDLKSILSTDELKFLQKMNKSLQVKFEFSQREWSKLWDAWRSRESSSR